MIPALVLALVSAGTAQAQRGYSGAHYDLLDEAITLRDAGQWSDAFRLYKQLLPLDTTYAEAYYGIGLCEANMPGKYQDAAAHFELAVRHGSTEAIFQLAMARHKQGRIAEELELLGQYRNRRGRAITDAEVDRQIAVANNAQTQRNTNGNIRIRNLGATINTPAHDYCPLITADGKTLFFTSRRAGSMGGRKDASGQFYEDIYTAQLTDGVWSRAMNMQAPVNSGMQDATVGLSTDGNEMVIYRASNDQPDGNLYFTERAQGVWSEPRRMTDHINSKAHEPSATIAPNGSEIYFTSNRQGGFGGRDLYRIRRLPNGEWSLPLNLGPNINTPYDEDAPFLHSDGTTLFFSSNGHNTMGGFDVFKATLLNPDMNVWNKPENMGPPLNTVNDDIYFCLSADGHTGYFSSEREGGVGGQDIYQVLFPANQIDYMLVRGVVTDPEEGPLKARITLTMPGGEEIFGIYNTNPRTGRYVMAVKPGGTYHLSVQAKGFTTLEQELYTADATGELALDIPMVRNERTTEAIKH